MEEKKLEMYLTTNFCRKKQDTQPVENEDEESLPENPRSIADDINVSRTLTFEVHDNEQKLKGDQVKANLKKPPINTGLTAQSPASKAFFTPTKEEASNNSEQVGRLGLCYGSKPFFLFTVIQIIRL